MAATTDTDPETPGTAPLLDESSEPASGSGPGSEETADASSAERSAPGQVFRVVGSVIAQTTLLTALMFYFGMQHAYYFFWYFGVNYTAMDLATQDYLLRSADGLFVPLIAMAALGAVSIWLYRLGQGRLSAQMLLRVQRATTVAAAAVGLVALGVAVAAVLDRSVLVGYPFAPGLCLVAGVLLVAFASRSQRWPARADRPRALLPAGAAIAEWAAVFVLVGAGLFWAAGSYSAAVGTQRGAQTEAQLPIWPDATVLSAESLNLPESSATELECLPTEAAYAYRYDGLKLIFASGSQYFLLPENWASGTGKAIVIPRTDSIRLEFSTPGTARPASC